MKNSYCHLVLVLLFAAPAAAVAAGDPAAGQAKSQVCAACHGDDGNSTDPQYPKLAEQDPEYIVQALKDYKSGARNNAIMSGFATQLSLEDMKDLGAYYADQPGDLFTPTDY